MSAEVEARWANLRAGEHSLTEREALSLAAPAYDIWIRWHEDEPSQQFSWYPPAYPELWTKTLDGPLLGPDRSSAIAFEDVQIDAMRRLCFSQADACLEQKGLKVDAFSRLKLAKAFGISFQRASVALQSIASGDLVADDVLPQIERGSAQQGPSRPEERITDRNIGQRGVVTPSVSMTGLFEAWWREARASGRKPSTHESYRNTVRSLVAFLKHDDAAYITPEDVVAFKDHRLTTPSPRTGKVPSPKTVKDSDLSALKTLFGWALMNRKLPMNPASGLTIRVGRKAQVRNKGFVEAEVRAILSAALAYEAGPRENHRTAAAKKWVPWLCAFSGARVGEIAQLRRQDVRKEGEWWVVRITPEAGTVKTNEAREFVLHRQLIDLGFPAFVEGSDDDHLFLVRGDDGDVTGPLSGLLNRLREFVRPIVPDPNVQPNHGWRHLFTTRCIEAGIETRVYNAIQGHAGTSVADRYGDVTLKAKADAMKRFPAIGLLDTD